MESALADSAPESAAAAQQLLTRAKAMTPGPDMALTLLAADALITLSCELVATDHAAEA